MRGIYPSRFRCAGWVDEFAVDQLIERRRSVGQNDAMSSDVTSTDMTSSGQWNLPVQPPIEPMLAKLAGKIPDGDGWLYEPKWDGFRCIVFRENDRIELFSRKLKPLARYFPELLDPLRRALPQRCIVDGEIVIPDSRDHGLDFDALLQRIHPAESRILRLAAETPSEFVAFDAIALGDESLLDVTMLERRRRLLDLVGPNERVRITPASTDRGKADEWFSTFEGAGLDGIIAKPLNGTYEPGKRSLIKVKHTRTADCAVPGYRIHKDGNGVGSLLLGLYDAAGDMQSVGVAASFSVVRRAELLEELAPRTGPEALVGHPWVDWAHWQDEQRALKVANDEVGKPTPPSAGSRWNAGKDLSFVPIQMGLVAEVTFGQLEGGRFRHGVGFVRWRLDRSPESCRFDQLDVANPIAFSDVFASQR
jgi:ATP-dependent DNA ligase